MKKPFNRMSGFIIKIIALVSMTFDHIGAIAITDPNLYYVFRGIGRLALPLFCFLIVEGVLHTKSIGKYLLRLGIMASIIALVMTIFNFAPIVDKDLSLIRDQICSAGNIFLDLLACAIVVWCIKTKKISYILLAIIPVVLSLLSFNAKYYSFITGTTYVYFPRFIWFQYDWISILMSVGFYFSYKAANVYWESQSNVNGMSLEVVKETNNYRVSVNLFYLLVVIVTQVFYFSIFYMVGSTFWDHNIQLLSLLGGIILLFYNGKRGYNKKWFQYGCYIYYPLHIVIIALITFLISL